MKTKKSKIPEKAICNQYAPIHYKDCYKCAVYTEKEINADDLLVAFWTQMPGWINLLFKIRNLLVKIVGLKTDGNNPDQLEEAIRYGKPHNIISLSDKTDNETIISLDDKHLIAYLGVYIEKNGNNKDIYTTTLVRFKKPLGYIYFYAIYPFHHLIIKQMISKTIKNFI